MSDAGLDATSTVWFYHRLFAKPACRNLSEQLRRSRSRGGPERIGSCLLPTYPSAGIGWGWAGKVLLEEEGFREEISTVTMLDNVWEWCEDRSIGIGDPPESGFGQDRRVIRGACGFTSPRECAC